MEIEAVADHLRKLLMNCRRDIDPVHFERINDIIRLARALPNVDPLVGHTSRTAATFHPFAQLSDGVRYDMFMMHILHVPLRERLARWARFRCYTKPLLSKWMIQAIDVELQRVVAEMRAQRPYVPRDSKDVFEVQALLCISLGLPQTVACHILEYAEYWIRSVGKGGDFRITQGTPYAAQVKIPTTAWPRKPVRRIIFIVNARECVPNPQLAGEPKTWFEVEATAPWKYGETSARRTKLLFYNMKPGLLPADWFFVHLIQWDGDCTDGEGPSGDTELQDWLSILQPGDELRLRAGSEGQGATNDVGPVRIEVYCACV